VSIKIDVISDVICPWCYIGKRRLEKAIVASGRKDVTVRWHPFELNPQMPKEGIERRDYRIAKFGSWERSQVLDAQVAAAGQAEGLTFDFEKMSRTPNTRDAHRLIWLADQVGVQDAVAEALFRAYFTEGRDLSDRPTMVDVVTAAGLDRSPAERLLASDEGLNQILTAEAEARELGVRSVPCFIVNGTVGLSGARDPREFLAAFEQAEPATGPAEGVCQIDADGGAKC
jgi:predicted DsbA family dithiol-disulfide isomerase